MRIYYTSLLFFFFSFSSFAQQGNPPMLWLSGVESSSTELGIEILDITVAGSVYVIARCYVTCTFPNGIVIIPDSQGSSTFLVKYAALNGTIEWVKDLGYFGDEDNMVHICSAPSQGVFIASSFTVPQVNFGNGISVQRSCTFNCQEGFVVRFNPQGQAMWAKTVVGAEFSQFYSAGIEADQQGKIYFAGNYEGFKADFGANFVYNNLPGGSLFLAIYNAANGNIQDVYFLAPDSGTASVLHLAVNDNNQAVLVGNYSGTLKFANGLSLNTTSTFGSGFTVGLSTDGTAQWAHDIGSSDYIDILGIDIDPEGAAYLAIDASTNLLFDNNLILTISTDYAGIVLKVGPSEFSLPVVIEYSSDDYPVMDVELDNMGNIYTAGYTSVPVEIGGSIVTVGGCVDGLITGTNKDGVFMWARTVGGLGCEGMFNFYYASCIAFDEVGFMYATGLYLGGFNEDGYDLNGGGGFVTKFHTSIVGTDDPGSVGALDISPNPSTGNFSISLEEIPPANTQLIVHDLGGREVYRQVITDRQTEIQTSLPSGAYIVTVQNGERLERQKLIIQR